MLEVFRNQSRSLAIYLILGAIILAFVLTFNTQGPISGNPNAPSTDTLVEVAGTPIDNRELGLASMFSADAPNPAMGGFERFQASQRYESTRLLWSGVSPELAGLTPFDGAVPAVKKEKVMVELIESVLAAKAAEQLGLGVSDEELSARVARLEKVFGTSFKDDQGRFDPKKYDTFVRYQLGTSKGALEAFLSREILRDKLALVSTAGVTVSDAELAAVAAAELDRPRLEVVTIDARAAKAAVQVSDEDATAYAAKNADKIKAAYEAAGEKYVKPAKWTVRGILVKATDKSTAEESKKAEIDAEWATKKTAADAVRADLDKAWKGEVAIDVASADGGSESKKATEIADVALRNKALFGFFSAKASEKSEHDLTKEVGGRFLDPKSKDALGRSPMGPAVAAAVEGAEVGSLVGPVEGAHGWWVLVVEGKDEAKTTSLEAASLELAKGLLAEERAAEQLDGIAKGVLEAAQAAKDKALAESIKGWNKAHGGKEDGPLTATTSGMIGEAPSAQLQKGLQAALGLPPRADGQDEVPGVGKNAEMVAAAWKLTAEAPLAGQVFKSEDGKSRYVVRLAAPAEKSDDEKKAAETTRDNLRKTLLALKRAETWRGVVKQMMQKAEAAGEIERSDAWSQVVEAERQRLADAQKRAAASAPAAAGNPFSITSGGQPIQLNVGGEAAPAAPAAPAEAAPAAPAAPAEKPAE